MLWGALALHVLAALAGAGRAAAARRPRRRRSSEGTTVGHVDQVIAGAGGLPGRADRADPLRAATSARRSASRCWPSCARTSSATRSPCRSGVVESAGSGDLLTRTSRDVDQLGWSVRWALPEWTIAVVTAVVTFVAAISVGLVGRAARACSALPPLVIGLRWYLARAKDGYLRESASYSAINATLTETVEGARTVEALGPRRRADRGDRRRHPRVVRAPSATRSTCAPCSSRAWSCPT